MSATLHVEAVREGTRFRLVSEDERRSVDRIVSAHTLLLVPAPDWTVLRVVDTLERALGERAS